jgi:signal transduction histidine kinase
MPVTVRRPRWPPRVAAGDERRALRVLAYSLALASAAAWTLLHAGRDGLAPALTACTVLLSLLLERRLSERPAQALALAWLVAATLLAHRTLNAGDALAMQTALLLLAPGLLDPPGTVLLALLSLAPLEVMAGSPALRGETLASRLAPALVAPLLSVLIVWLLGRLRGAEQRVERLRAAQARMVDTIGHEVRTPLTKVKVLSDLLVRLLPLSPPPEQLRAMTPLLVDLQRHCDELTGSVERAQWYQHLASHQVALGTAPVDLAALLGALVAEQAGRAAAAELALALDAPARLDAPANARALRRALEAVLDNALKFTPPGGRVAVRATRRRGWAELEIADDGPGIRAEDLPYVCEPFFHREHLIDAGDHQRGIGLGLAIARQIVAAHGGALRIASAPGAGTRVTLRLPLGPRPSGERRDHKLIPR